MEVETEKAGVSTTLDIAENNIEQLKTEISYLSKEKAEVVDSLNAVRTYGYYISIYMLQHFEKSSVLLCNHKFHLLIKMICGIDLLYSMCMVMLVTYC